MLYAIGLGIGLAMDASCVSMTNAMVEKNMRLVKALAMACLFGLFQFVMPLIGYFLGSLLSKYISAFIPIIALILLSIIGIKMIIESVKEKKEGEELKQKKISPAELFLQGLATSIDALSVGVLFIADTKSSAVLSFAIIGCVTFALTLIAFFIGKKLGLLLKNKAAIVGGVILIAIGLEIFIKSLIG
ncbi:MAG: manganese efflux pump MntP family protein [Clostridia bacterium]|nr:manganese efflux pump MntP family protein [Clostridia bacterium]MDE7328610.1 manganese efflux pump MntP family protein [Clostridia bacterium]